MDSNFQAPGSKDKACLPVNPPVVGRQELRIRIKNKE
jgi:hypothetical protein